MRKLALAVLLGLAAAPPARAQTATLYVCNTGTIDIDVFTLETGPTRSSNIKPSTCGAVAAAGASGTEAYLGFAFVDSRGEWGAPRRFDSVPNMGVRQIPQAVKVAAALKGQQIPPQPRIVSAADKSATVRHGGVFATLPMQLLFQPAFPACRIVRHDLIGELPETVCENFVYTLMIEAHTDSHEASLGSLPVGGGFEDGPPLSAVIEKTAQINWAQVAAERKQRETPTSMSWNDLMPAFKQSLQTVRDPDSLTGLRYPYAIPEFIKVRGTVSAVEIRQHTFDEHTKVPVAEINFRESPLAAGTSYPEFNVCTTRLDVLQEVFGADFRTSMIGKTIEVEGRPRGLCWGQVGEIEIFLARQVRPVGWAPSASPAREQTTAQNAAAAGGVQSVAGYQPSWIGHKMVVIGTVSRFVRRDVNGEKYVYLYFKERPDSTVVACSRDDYWLLGVLGIDDFESVVGTTLQFDGEVVNGTCTQQGAGLWIYQRDQARIVGGPAR